MRLSLRLAYLKMEGSIRQDSGFRSQGQGSGFRTGESELWIDTIVLGIKQGMGWEARGVFPPVLKRQQALERSADCRQLLLSAFLCVLCG
jgi:hypothetical protein